MSSSEDHNDDISLACEYVLHLLDLPDRAAFERRMKAEFELRKLVRVWDEDLIVFARDFAPVAPPARLKLELETRLFSDTTTRLNSIWTWVTVGIVAACVLIGVMLYTPFGRDADPLTPTYSASVASEDGSLVFNAGFNALTNTLKMTRVTGDARPGRTLELWLIADGAAAPVSLGVLPATRETQITLSEAHATRMRGGVLAISDEPTGGSPTGAPTGDVLAIGPLGDT